MTNDFSDRESGIDFDAHASALENVLSDLFDSVHTSNTWTTWPIEEQLALRSLINQGQAIFERVLRPKFDNVVYNGRVDARVKSIRTKGEYATRPGKPASVPTAEQVLANAMKR